MARLTDIQRSALGHWWTLAESGAYGGYLSTDVISAASDLARQQGTTISFQEAHAISTLYGYGRRMSNAADVLQGAPDEAVIGAEMIGVPPWAREQQAMNTTPIWHVTYEFSYVNKAGLPQTDLRTSVFEMTMPDVVGDLKQALTEDAQSLADKYGVELLDVSLREILAV